MGGEGDWEVNSLFRDFQILNCEAVGVLIYEAVWLRNHEAVGFRNREAGRLLLSLAIHFPQYKINGAQNGNQV